MAREDGPPATVRVEFHPPLGKVFRYHVTKTTRAEISGPPTELDQELSFEQIAAGHLLHIGTTKIERGGQTFTPESAYTLMIPAEDAVSLLTPITLRLGPSGRIIAVHDWDKIRDVIRTIPDRVLPQLPESVRENARPRIESGLQGIIQVSDQGAVAFIAKEWPPTLTYGGATFEVGKTVTTTSSYYLFDGSVPVDLIHDVIVVPRAGGGLVLTETQHTDTESFASAIASYAAQTPLPDQDEAARQANIARMREFERVSTTHLELDEDGVLLSGYWEVRMEREGVVGESTKVTFERLD